MDDSGDNHVGW